MTDFVGLTWDHPRGRHALEAAAGSIGSGDSLRWEAQSLEGFESAPIDELARRYDLLVLDHPHLGDALVAQCLVPVDTLFPPAQLAQWTDAAIGPSLESYRLGGHVWALPLDAATQVSARNPALVPVAPESWDDAIRLAGDGLVATTLAGPHAFLSLCSIAVSLGDDPAAASDRLFDPAIAAEALRLLIALSALAPAGTAALNPIGLLDRMRDAGDIGYVPLIYGYVTHSSPSVVFGPPPTAGGRIGSTIGGTGIAVTTRTSATPALLAHLAWLLDAETQSTFIPEHDGQPSAAIAWHDDHVDAAASGFYRATAATIDQSWVRPRLPGFTRFQSAASAIVRDTVAGRLSPAEAIPLIERRFTDIRAAAARMPAFAHALQEQPA
ncbi:hypothetical protein [Microbacterium pumilum]|uniref:Extracellular solute-binding protein n=1 Tax=Microbacterium pumilum TaxID=344165 RepID=A0ABN2S5C9_9MICO